ncbi:MAG: UDP-N-acetylmuramyl-tripeptide synthetase [Spirochaetia bacterium]|nr:UDP-N-acetylmuramyl-tripeptide synthetase [Spirochaetia bacterium]
MLMKRLTALWAIDKLIGTCVIRGDEEVLISSVVINSNNCTPHSLFVAQKGLHTDGHLYIDHAIDRGATAILHSSPITNPKMGITYIETQEVVSVSSLLAYHLYGPYPEEIIGVTGTDGKSTTCEFLYTILTSIGFRCGLLSTISIDSGNGKTLSPYRMSTPEVDILYPFLHECFVNKVDYVILEATSHGLSKKTGRLAHLSFSGAIMNEITSEHLDFHHTREEYIQDKLNLVRQLKKEAPLVTNTSFSCKKKALSLLFDKKQLITYSVEEPSIKSVIHTHTTDVTIDSRSIMVNGLVPLTYSYAPEVYLSNLTSAIALAHAITKKPIKELIKRDLTFSQMPGRYEIVYHNREVIIINDFAHTPDAFYHLFSFMRNIAPNYHISALFGAAGERDKSKREGLGHIASLYCDTIYLTNEDPRNEDPLALIEDIKRGFAKESTCKTFTILNRKDAIREAVSTLQAKHILLLLGKGHEKSINHGSSIEQWNESEVTLQLLREKNEIT